MNLSMGFARGHDGVARGYRWGYKRLSIGLHEVIDGVARGYRWGCTRLSMGLLEVIDMVEAHGYLVTIKLSRCHCYF